MDITFSLASTTRVMTEENWGIAPMGGAEVSAVNLGRELLELGHEVHYYLQRAEPFDRDNLHVHRHEEIFDRTHGHFIFVRPSKVICPKVRKIKADKILLWSGDAYDQSSNEVFDDKDTAGAFDAFVFKTKWQREKILERFYHIQPALAHVIYNGVRAEIFKDLRETPQSNRFIYASTWYRGLSNFIDLWPKIIKEIPNAEIHVFAKTSLYSGSDMAAQILDGRVIIKDAGYYGIVEELVKLPGMILREPIPQWMLVKELAKSWAMLYPNTGFVESSCGVAIQSQAAGTPVITLARAGLVETVDGGGILIEETEDWKEKFVEGVVECQRSTLRNQLSSYGRRKVFNQSWKKKAQEWMTFLKSL